MNLSKFALVLPTYCSSIYCFELLVKLMLASTKILRLLGGILVFTMGTVGSSASASDSIVALVDVQSNRLLVKVPAPCAPQHETVCMNSWSRYVLHVKKILSGHRIPKSIAAVRIQHTDFSFEKYEVAVVVLEAIDSKVDRQLFGADYRIREFILPSYCFEQPISEYGLETSRSSSNGCYIGLNLRRLQSQ
jgi:hypothetical protein